MEEQGNLFQLIFPIWGAEFSIQEPKRVGDRVTIYIPSIDDWREIQKTNIYVIRWRYADMFEGPNPPVCLSTYFLLDKSENFSTKVDQFGPKMLDFIREAVLVLRLFKLGWFLDPELSEGVFLNPDRNHLFNNIIRFSDGPYRQFFLQGNEYTMPMKPYKLEKSDFHSQEKHKDSLERIWQIVKRYYANPNVSAEIAIENFQRAYGFKLEGAQRAMFQFISLDAILGAMRIRTFSERLKGVLMSYKERNFDQEIDPIKEAEWLNSTGRKIRNSIAHGRLIEINQKARMNYERIQNIVRIILGEYLDFCGKWADSKNKFKTIGVSESFPVGKAFNYILNRIGQNSAEYLKRYTSIQ